MAETRIHVIPVGVSLWNNVRNEPSRLTDEGGVRWSEFKRFSEQLSLSHNSPTEDRESEQTTEGRINDFLEKKETENTKSLEKLNDFLPPNRLKTDATAELSTFRSVTGGIRLKDRDTVLFLVSDSASAKYAALWSALALTGGERGRVRYLTNPAENLPELKHHVTIARIPELDIAATEQFRRAMRQLGRVGKGLLEMLAHRPERNAVLTFHLSGGFKAYIPHFQGLAEALRTATSPNNVEAYMLHEHSERGGPIPIPLRSVNREAMFEEIGQVTDGFLARKPNSQKRSFEGFAYERHESTGPSGKPTETYRLTPFGEAIMEITR
ncbi:hypothetical protein FHX37_3980 [Haloactinospora alba]|uniref:Uncharacterized protein n=1 Tax=Haloactinospora alba TaxID=405555 RepID=A0A543N9X8_9ACTN|nr:hypothetical protein [Haloactinospora alba]TQN28623.1 hypothetical protein FHX37_3980 [Haloactinospora alba]